MLFSDLLKQLNVSQEDVLFPKGKTVADYSQAQITGICQNAQEAKEGFVFAAVKGTKTDGALFIGQAVQNGATFVLCDRKIEAPVPVICVLNIRRAVALASDALYPSETIKKIAVTGTNGKTSTVYFVRQILNETSFCAASMGTIGVDSPVYKKTGSMTTPASEVLHATLQELADKKVQYVVLEASSHGLHQNRLDGIQFISSGFTNLTRDHLDYHQTMENYLSAKTLLFTERTDKDGVVVLNADVPQYEQIEALVRQKNIRVLSYGKNGKELKLVSQKPTLEGQDVVLELLGKTYTVSLGIFGDFQVMNILCAIGLSLGAGLSVEQIVAVLPHLKAPDGRMERVAQVNGAQVFVDYAHTPDALERVLTSLRAHTDKKLVCLFGCGGNRDTGKRPQMGEIANRLADKVYITDDNPRFEEAQVIRQEILNACPKGIECQSRIEAVDKALQGLEEGDILVLCGKGHETGQTVAGNVFHFNDKSEVLVQSAAFEKEVLWQSSDLALALNAAVSPFVKGTGVSIDTRTLQVGDVFIAIKGENLDGHQFVQTALDKGASVVIVDHLMADVLPEKQIVVPDTTDALEALARFSRMRSGAVFIGITGSSGKTTTKEMLKAVLSKQGNTFATSGNLNNQIGVPLNLARLPLYTEYAILEMGMNHFGEMTYLSDLVRPNLTLITMVGAAHRAYFKDDAAIAEAKAEIYEYADKQGVAVLNAESPFYSYLSEQAYKNNIRKVVSFGAVKGADFELMDCVVMADKTAVHFSWHGTDYHYQIGFSGRHFALNSLGVLALVDALGASVEQAMADLKETHPVAGRGACEDVRLSTGAKITLIDDAYNANPLSMKASIQTLGAHKNRRRIAVLGDMLELGESSAAFHQGLAADLIENDIQFVFCVGTEMKALYEALPVEKKGGYAQNVEEIMPLLIKFLQMNDIVLIKASNGMGLKKIITTLKEKE